MPLDINFALTMKMCNKSKMWQLKFGLLLNIILLNVQHTMLKFEGGIIMISYNNLWITLDKCKITKTELRQRIGISSSTFAKLSSNQPVAIEIIEKICKEIGCTPNDVMNILPESASFPDWSGIVDNATYLIKIYFYRTKDEAQYVYGFASPFRMTMEGLDEWKLSKHAELPTFLVIDGYAQGTTLRTIIHDACEHMTLRQIFNALNIKFSLNQCTNYDQDAIYALQICNGAFTHRPIFMLPNSAYCNRYKPVLHPLQSFDDSFMYCESLFGNDKELLYYTDDQPNSLKATLLWKLFQTEFSNNINSNEMARLSNFELFSYFNGELDGNSGFDLKIITKDNNYGQVAEGIRFSFDHKFFNGHYAIRACISNTENPFLDILKLFYCDREDFSFFIPLQESPTNIEIQIWKITPDSSMTNLVHAFYGTLIRGVQLDIRLIERRFRIEDDWTRKMDDMQISIKKEGEYVSHFPSSFGNTNNESWVNCEESTQKFFRDMFNGTGNGRNDELFLEAGNDKHIRFLEWLRKTLSATGIHRVILIDPFVDVTTITKYLRSISDACVTYEIYTNEDDNKRIKSILAIKEKLDLISPGKLKIATLPAEILHDRFLILLGDDAIPQVYSMSNSLDHLAEKHASLILPTSGKSARRVYDYYIELFSRCKTEGKLNLIYDSTHLVSNSIEKKNESGEDIFNGKIEILATFETFKKQLRSNLSSALESIAYMSPEEEMKCKEFICSKKDTVFVQELVALLQEYVKDGSECKEQKTSLKKLYTSKLLLQGFDHDCKLFDSASKIQDYCYEYVHGFRNYSIYYAAKELLELDKLSYISVLSDLREQLHIDDAYMDTRIYSLATFMLGFLAETLALKQFTKEDTLLLMSSEIPFLKALGITHTLLTVTKAPYKEILPTLDYIVKYIQPKESLYTMIYQIRELQILFCQNFNEYNAVEPIISQICNLIVSTIVHIAIDTTSNTVFSKDELYEMLMPLYFRNSEDICRIILELFKNHYFTSDDATDILTDLLFEKYNKGISNNNLYFTQDDLSESCMITSYLYQIDKTSIKKLKLKLSRLERKIGSRFYQAFLKTQNYSLWKCSIDLYGCMVYLELKLESLYNAKRSRAVAEYKCIATNYMSTLEKYSDIYRLLRQEYPDAIIGE